MEYHWCQFHIWSSLSGTFPTSPPLHVALSHDLLSALESVWYKRITSLVLCLIHFGLLIFNPKQVKLSVRRDAHAVHNGKPSRPILRQLSIFPCPLLLPPRQFFSLALRPLHSQPTKPQTERIQRLSPVGTIRRSVQPTSRPLSSPFQLPLFPNQGLTFPIGSANVWDNSTDEDKSGFLTCGTENAGQRLEACHRTPVKPPPSWASN